MHESMSSVVGTLLSGARAVAFSYAGGRRQPIGTNNCATASKLQNHTNIMKPPTSQNPENPPKNKVGQK
eukprot:4210241-Amphidinium_carterae.1